MSATGKIRVYLLDDHELIRRGIKDLLEESEEITVVGEAGLAEDAKREIPVLRPDVAILDGRLPDGSGVDVCREVRSQEPGIAALILTSYDDDDALFSAIMAGAAGYVLKQVRSNDLVETVRQVAAGRSMLDPVVTAKVLERIRSDALFGAPTVQQPATSAQPTAPTAAAEPVGTHLTPHEQRILSLIGEGRTNRQIAQELHLAEKTIKNYVSSLLSKLGLESRTQAAIMVTRRQQR